MCDDPQLQAIHTVNTTFPAEAALIPSHQPIRATVLAFKPKVAEEIAGVLQDFSGESLVTVSIGGCYPDLTPQLVTQLSEQSDLLVIGDHLLAWEHHQLFSELHCPVIMADPSLVFHPYQGAARQTLKQRGFTVLPAETPAKISDSIAAVRAQTWLRDSTLLMVCNPDDPHPMRSNIQARAAALHQSTGARVIVIPVTRLQLMASQVTDTIALQVWEHWRQTLVSEIDEALSQQHLLEVAKLYVAMRQLIDEHQANAIAVQEFEPFLFQGKTMPNVAYAALRAQGITTAEEGDLTMLITQMLMASINQQQAMMANVYLGYRDAWEADKSHSAYGPKGIAADFHQSVAESTVMLCHFATAGTVPRSMTDDAKYRVIQTLPSWTGQSMTFAIPKLGDVLLARLDEEAGQLHVYPGTVTQTYDDPQGGWYRGRWLVKLKDIHHFVNHAFSAHYAIGMNPQLPALQLLCDLRNIELCVHGG